MRVGFTILVAIILACLSLVNVDRRPPQSKKFLTAGELGHYAGSTPALATRLVKQPQQRKSYMETAAIQHNAGSASMVANDPRPLAQAIAAVRKEYGWLINYEDPPYESDSELVDVTDSQWRASHPGSPGHRIANGGSFQCVYTEGPDIQTTAGQESVLRQIVSAYNRSGNPGKFIVRVEEEGRYSVVGFSVKDRTEKEHNIEPMLDTPITIPTEQRSAYEAVKLIVRELSTKSGIQVKLLMGPTNILLQSQVTIGGNDLPARVLLLQTLKATKRPLLWQLLYDANQPFYGLNISIAA